MKSKEAETFWQESQTGGQGGHDDLMHLMEELETLPEADPGQAYWNQFNGAFQQRLQQQSARKRQRKWLRLPLGLSGVLGALAAVWLLVGNPQPVKVPSLDQLSGESLSLVLGMMDPLEDAEIAELDAAEAEQLANASDLIYGEDYFEGWDEAAAGDEDDQWNLEG